MWQTLLFVDVDVDVDDGDGDDTNCYILMLKHTLHAYQIDKNYYGKLHKTNMLIKITEKIVTNACMQAQIKNKC